MGMQVYVVEDNEAVQGAIKAVLDSMQVSCQCYGTAEEFLAIMDDVGPGCVILDMQLPGMSGRELLSHLTQRQKNWPVIVITGYGDLQAAFEAGKMGAAAFLKKPFSCHQLRECVSQALGKLCVIREKLLEAIDIVRKFDGLTRREKEVARCLSRGMDIKTIAGTLKIRPKTVDFHRLRLMEKMGAETPVELALQLTRHNLLNDKVALHD